MSQYHTSEFEGAFDLFVHGLQVFVRVDGNRNVIDEGTELYIFVIDLNIQQVLQSCGVLFRA